MRLLRVECERVLALLSQLWVVTPQVPVTALNGTAFLSLRTTHATLDLQTVVDTRSVGDDERRSGISLCLADSLQTLSVIGAHSHLSYINIAIGCSNHTEVLLADALTLSSKLSDSAQRSSLRRLATGVRVNLGVEHEQVHILARSNHVVETTIADVVGGTVTTDDPL